MNRNIKEEKYKLIKRCRALRDLAKEGDLSYNKKIELYRKQGEIYKKYKFYDNLIKAREKIK